MTQPLDVAARYASPCEVIEHWTFNDSTGELFVPTLLPSVLELALGAPVRLCVQVRTEPSRIFRVLGRVAWIRRQQVGSRPAGVGISFAHRDLASRDLLWGFVAGQEVPFHDRGAARVPAELKVSCQARGEVLEETTEDISGGGTFIRSEKMPPVGTVVSLKFKPPRALFSMRLDGRITWHRNRSGDRGFGVRFVYRNQQQVSSVKRLVEQLTC